MHLIQKEKVSPLLDNFLGCKIINIEVEINIISLEFLPSKNTSCYQPINANIIASFKA